MGEVFVRVRPDTRGFADDAARDLVRFAAERLNRSGSLLGGNLGAALSGAATAKMRAGRPQFEAAVQQMFDARRAGTAAGRDFGSSVRRGFAAVGVAAIARDSVKLEAAFGQTLNTMAAVADVPQAGLEKLSKLALKMGADTVFSANDAANAMLSLAKGGLSAATIEAGALQGTLTLASAGGLELAAAADIAVNAMSAFSLKGSDMASVAAALAGGANASTASVESLAQALSQVGAGAKGAGLSLQETVAVLSAMDALGYKGSDAGTSLKVMLSRLVPQTDKAAAAMEELGLDFTDATGSFLSIEEIAGQLQKSLGKLTEEQRTLAIHTLFGADAQRAATTLMSLGTKGIRDYTKATSDQAAAERVAAARLQGTAGALEQLSGSVETLKLGLAKIAAPLVQDIAGTMTSLANFLAANPGVAEAAFKVAGVALALKTVNRGMREWRDLQAAIFALTRKTVTAQTAAATVSRGTSAPVAVRGGSVFASAGLSAGLSSGARAAATAAGATLGSAVVAVLAPLIAGTAAVFVLNDVVPDFGSDKTRQQTLLDKRAEVQRLAAQLGQSARLPETLDDFIRAENYKPAEQILNKRIAALREQARAAGLAIEGEGKLVKVITAGDRVREASARIDALLAQSSERLAKARQTMSEAIRKTAGDIMANVSLLDEVPKLAGLSVSKLMGRLRGNIADQRTLAANVRALVDAGFTRPMLDELMRVEREAPGTMSNLVKNGLTPAFVSELKSGFESMPNIARTIAKALEDDVVQAAEDAAATFNRVMGSRIGALKVAGIARGEARRDAAESTVPGRANGGRVSAGLPYVVGERRPELFVPDRSGTVLPRVPGGGMTRSEMKRLARYQAKENAKRLGPSVGRAAAVGINGGLALGRI